MNCKRILFLSPNLGSGGAERQIVTVASLFKGKGYDVEFLCYADGDFYAHILNDKGIKISWLDVQVKSFVGIVKIFNFICKGCFDVVVSFLDLPNFFNVIMSLSLKGKRWKIITGERSSAIAEFFNGYNKNRIYTWVQHYSDFIVCNSENARQNWLKYYPQCENRIKVIYNTVNLQPVSTEYIPKRDSRLHIVVAASYQYLKNPIGVVKALALMSDEEREKIRIDWYGRKEVVRGDTIAYDEAIELIKQHGLGDVIALHGDTKEIHDRMQEADMIALFSSREGLPNAICEGMTLGKPVIMSKVSDYDVLIDESNGFLCDWDSAESIKNVLIEASSLSVDELRQMGECSERKAKMMFSNETIIDKWIELIKK